MTDVEGYMKTVARSCMLVLLCALMGATLAGCCLFPDEPEEPIGEYYNEDLDGTNNQERLVQ